VRGVGAGSLPEEIHYSACKYYGRNAEAANPRLEEVARVQVETRR